MSQVPSPYPNQSPYASPIPQRVLPALNPETPPPPPPKPSSHETSRRATPQTSSPLAPIPQRQSQELHGPTGRTRAEYDTAEDTETQAQPFPEPPSVEENWLPDIVKDKSTTDLQTILQTPTLLTSLSTLHPSHTAHQQHLQALLTHNKTLATHLLSLQDLITTTRTATESLLLSHQGLEVSWRKKQAEMDAALAPWSPKALYQRLSAGIAEQEAVCLAVVESFLEEDRHQLHEQGRASEREVADWVRRVRGESARLADRREAKARWDEGRVGGWR